MIKPRFIILHAISKYLSEKQLIALKNDLTNVLRLTDVQYIKKIEKHFDFKQLIINPMDVRDAWIYNYLFYETKMKDNTKVDNIGSTINFQGKLLKQGLIKQYYNEVMLGKKTKRYFK